MFDIGSVVRLRSGGPAMTVVESGPNCNVNWFSGTSVYVNRFVNEALELVSTAKPTLSFDGKQFSVQLADGTVIDEGAIPIA